ncbi:hypothetical protein BO443_10758 [Burkholderia orbicola]
MPGSVKTKTFCATCARYSTPRATRSSVAAKSFRRLAFMTDSFVSGWEWIALYSNRFSR